VPIAVTLKLALVPGQLVRLAGRWWKPPRSEFTVRLALLLTEFAAGAADYHVVKIPASAPLTAFKMRLLPFSERTLVPLNH